MKKVLLSSALFLSAFGVHAQTLTAEFKSLVVKNKIGTTTEQAYCYEKDGVIHGYQPNKLQRIASVTKLFSTLLASETMDLNQRFTTKVYIGKDSLHIEGGQDPYFEEDKLLLLFKALNDLGYTSFKKVTFNRDFHFYDFAMGTFAKVTPEDSRLRLQYYLLAKNQVKVGTKWKVVKAFAEEEGVILGETAPSVTSPVVAVSDVNPLLGENPIVHVHRSKPFHRLLKTMNVQSKNFVAENTYNAASKIKSLSTLLKEKGIDAATFKIYNGSGLPIINGKNRTDNLATCATVLKVVGLLDKSLEKHHLTLKDVVAVNGGKDLGSFRERFLKQPELAESVISKTGTLKHTSTLAGVLLADSKIPFAILNHTVKMAVTRDFQDEFISRMFDDLGGAVPKDYEKIPIFPWYDNDFFTTFMR